MAHSVTRTLAMIAHNLSYTVAIGDPSAGLEFSEMSATHDAARLDGLLDAMHAAADAARAITVPRFRAAIDIDNKAGADAFDPVTSADRDAETCLRDHLLAAFPDVGFVGEESSQTMHAAGSAWVVDPIDGTRAFITGMPLWGTLIAFNDGDEAVLGLMDQPVLGERYVGRPGNASLHVDGRVQRLSTRRGVAMAEAMVCCTTPDMFTTDAERQAFGRVASAARLVRYGGDCYAYAQLAAGHIDIVIESDLKPWDIQALIPLIESAGGRISNWDGESAQAGGQILAAGSDALHAEALALIRGG